MKLWFGSILASIPGMMLCSAALAAEVTITNPTDGAVVSENVNIQAGLIPNLCTHNLQYQEINDYLDAKGSELSEIFYGADQAEVLDLIKALLFRESEWKQFRQNGSTMTNNNTNGSKDFGIAQINSVDSTLDRSWDMEKIQSDTKYNLEAKIQVFKNKKKDIELRKKNKEKWTSLLKNIGFEGRSESEILLKSYNGFVSTDYVDPIKKIAKSKPWEEKVAIHCHIDARLIDQQTIRLIDEYQHSWDSTTVKDGQHQIKVSIPKKSKDEISVSVNNEDEGDNLFVSNSCFFVAQDYDPTIEWQVWFPEDAIDYLKELKSKGGKLDKAIFDFDVESSAPFDFVVLDIYTRDFVAMYKGITQYHYHQEFSDLKWIVKEMRPLFGGGVSVQTDQPGGRKGIKIKNITVRVYGESSKPKNEDKK